MVENPTDEDWAGVKMALISGRPISFKMDLYNPLFINRPTVEPELFASLRPVTYRGGFGKPAAKGSLSKEASIEPDLRTCRPAKASAKAFRAGVAGFGGGADAGAAADSRRRHSEMESLRADRRRRTTRPRGTRVRVRPELGRRLATGRSATRRRPAALGDFFQYTIDHPVSLARQKSAMLPIVGKDIEGRRSPSTTRTCRPSTRCSA